MTSETNSPHVQEDITEVKNTQDFSEDEIDDGEDDLDDDDDYDDFVNDLNYLELKDLDEESLMFLSSVASHGVVADDSRVYDGYNGAESDIRKAEAGSSKALVPTDGRGDEDEINSEEENEILKDIRDEVENKVRGEMKVELEGYRQRIKAIGNGELPTRSQDFSQTIFGEEEEMDPKLKEAIVKMNKLDKILKKKMKMEKEVKRDRILLERRMRHEISELDHGASHYSEIKVNTQKFLALAPPPIHNEEVDEDAPGLPPLFQTQIDEADVTPDQGTTKHLDNPTGPEADSGGPEYSASQSSYQDETSRTHRPQGKKSKNFIKRNKELAADASQMIAMTDDEKKRLQDLLHDVDEIPELAGDNDDFFNLETNAFQMSVVPGSGFCPNRSELLSLTSIDDRLRSIMPEEDFLSISHSHSSAKLTPRPTPMFSRVGVASVIDDIPERFGERVLYETKEERALKARLNAIEQKLEQFKASYSAEENTSDFHLSDEQLDNLLDQCARSSISRLSYTDTPDLSARSVMTSRQALLENPPKLSEEQLEQLLSEAHFSISSSLLSEDDHKIEKTESWKEINETNVSARDSAPTELAQASQDEVNFSQNALDNLHREGVNIEEPVQNVAGGKPQHFTSTRRFSGDGNSTDRCRNVFPRIQEFKIHHSLSKEDYESDTGAWSTPNLSDESVRFPEIRSNSFLIQTEQGLNNDNKDGRDSLPSRQPLQMVHNDLSDSAGIQSGCTSPQYDRNSPHTKQHKLSSGMNPPLVPKPPAKDVSTKKRVSEN